MFSVEDHGSIVLIRPLTPAVEEWLDERVGGEDVQYWGDAVVVEPRYVRPIVEALIAEGFAAQ
jgi:hypothetical protein